MKAVELLDVVPLGQSYSASGSAACRPDLMTAIVPHEMRRERISPGQWHTDAKENPPGPVDRVWDPALEDVLARIPWPDGGAIRSFVCLCPLGFTKCLARPDRRV